MREVEETQLWKLEQEMQTHSAQPSSVSLNIVAHCGPNGLSILRTSLLTVHNLHFCTHHLFFYALEQHALPLSPEQYFTRVSRSAAESLLLYKDLPIYLEELPESSSVLCPKHSAQRLSLPSFTKQLQCCPEL